MAVLETLRKKAGPVLVGVIGIALLSFVVGDLFGTKRGSGGLFSSNNVGKINGKNISYEDYMHKVDYYTEIYRLMYGQNAGNEALNEEVREQAWLALIREYSLEPEFKKLDLNVSGDELFDLIQGRNPAPLIIRNFTNPQTGEFDRVNLLTYLQNLDVNPNPEAKIYWLFLEKEIISQRIQSKMVHLVAKALYTTNLDAQNAVNNNANTVDINYIVRKMSDVSDSLVNISSGEVKKYYKDHKKKYKQSESTDIEYVSFAIAPSVEDDNAVKGWIDELAPQFEKSEDVRQFVMQHSDVPFDVGYYKKSELTESKIAEFAFAETTKDMLAPYMSDGSYKMVRIADVRHLPDTVKARHILLSNTEGLEATRKLADSIKTLLQKGASFTELAEKYSIDQAANQKGGDLGWFPQNAMVKPFGDSCFFASKGKIMVLETQFGVHIVQVTDKGEAEKKVQLAIVKRDVVPSKITRTQIFAEANDVVNQSKNRETFLEAIAQKNIRPRVANKITINDRGIQALPAARELVRWACKAKKNEISPIFEVDDNFVIATLSQQREDGYAPVEQVKSEITSILRQQKSGELLLEEMQGGQSLDELSRKFNLTIQPATGLSFSSFYIPGLGVEPNLSAAVSVTPQGQVATPVIGNAGVYVYSVTAANKAASPEAVAAEKSRMRATAIQRASHEVFNTIHLASDIKDVRGKFVF